MSDLQTFKGYRQELDTAMAILAKDIAMVEKEQHTFNSRDKIPADYFELRRLLNSVRYMETLIDCLEDIFLLLSATR